MNYLDSQLQKIQEDNIQEIEPLILSAVVGTVYLISTITTFLLSASQLKKRIKIDKKWTKKINNILKSKGKWIVHIFPDPTPNAFAIGGRHIFITSGLSKILTTREIEAVLLHEVYHNKDKHIYKKLAYKHSLIYLILFAAISASAATGAFPLGLLVLFLLNNVSEIAYNRIVGRRHEIKSDEFAIKLGYGKDLITSLKKLEKALHKQMKKTSCGVWCKFERKVSDAIDEHPSTRKRVEVILRKSSELDKLMKTASFGKIKKFIEGVFKKNG
jgi:Zn-dependent protease with chaperone function